MITALQLITSQSIVPAGISGRQSIETAGPTDWVVVLLAGQSNMVGNKTTVPYYTYDSVLDPTSSRIRQWSYDGQGVPARANVLLPAIDPLLHPSLADVNRAVGQGMSFARSLLATLASNQGIILVPTAVGGTGLVGNVWAAPSGTLYVAARNALIACLAAIPNSHCEYMLWWQGENDMIGNVGFAPYASALDAVIAGFRTASGAGVAASKFLISGILPEYYASTTPAKLGVQTALSDTPLRNSNCYCVMPDFGWSGGGDTVHALPASQRIVGANVFTARDLAATYTGSAPATPLGVQLEGEVISWLADGSAPAYVVQSRAAGSADAWTETLVYPFKMFGDISRRYCVYPGAGGREGRVLARSKFGDSAPSAMFTYTVPVTGLPTFLWDHDYDASPASGGNIVTVTSVGTDTADWTPFGTIPKVIVNGRGALNQTTMTQALFRAVRVPVGSYTVIAACEMNVEGSDLMVGGVGDLTHGFEVSWRVGGVGAHRTTAVHNNSSAISSSRGNIAITNAGGRVKICIAYAYDSVAGTMTLYVNGALYATGTIATRNSVSISTKAWNWLSDGRGDGFIGTKYAWKLASSVLTQAEIIRVAHEIKTLYGIEWGT